MPRPGAQVGGLRSVGVKDEASSNGGGTTLPPPVYSSGRKYEYTSRKASLLVTLKERAVHWRPDGTSQEEIPRTANGTRCDMIRFVEHHFGHDDPELHKLIQKLPPELYGLDGLFYSTKAMRKAQDQATADQIRTLIRENPSLRAALEPGTTADWAEMQNEATEPQKPEPEYSEEELDELTRPENDLTART